MQKQRHPVEAIRSTLEMTRPADLPRFATMGERIKHWRSKRKMTVKRLAAITGIAESTLYGIQGGAQSGSTKTVAIARALKISANYLATDNGDPEDLNDTSGAQETVEWNFPFEKEEYLELSDTERELVGLKFRDAVREVRARWPKARKRAP